MSKKDKIDAVQKATKFIENCHALKEVIPKLKKTLKSGGD